MPVRTLVEAADDLLSRPEMEPARAVCLEVLGQAARGAEPYAGAARTLLLDPAILIFDDSTASVDTQTEYLILQALQELMRGRTTFVIAQRLRTVMRADEIVVRGLDGGLHFGGFIETLLFEFVAHGLQHGATGVLAAEVAQLRAATE